MTLTVPDLDDIEFSELVEDGRAQIPRHAPEWTDHNLHDPGITLIDLIAHLADQHIYRIGFVGDSLRAAFTRLLGIVPRGPEPAHMLIWPDAGVAANTYREGVAIDSPDIPEAQFTLERDVSVIDSRIGQILLVTDAGRRPLGTGLVHGRDPLTLLPHSGGGPRALDIVLSNPQRGAVLAAPVSLGFMLDGPAVTADWTGLALEQWDRGGFWRPLDCTIRLPETPAEDTPSGSHAGAEDAASEGAGQSVMPIRDTTGGLSRSGIIFFVPDLSGPKLRLRVRLDRGFRPGTVTLTRIGLNVLPAVEGRNDPGETLGEGRGLPDHAVPFDASDLQDPSELQILVDSEGITQRYELRPDFARSGPEDRHVVLTKEGLRFGNGLNGGLVPRGAAIRYGAVRRTAGADGAVAQGLRWRIARARFGTNLAPSTPGRDADTLKDLTRRARTAARRREALLRDEDIRAVLLAAPLGLADARVVSRRRPGFDDGEAPGSRTVLILPDRDPARPPLPPNPRLRTVVERALAPHRLLGERLHISEPLHRFVDVAAHLVVATDADTARVVAKAEARLRQRLWDLRRTPDQEIAPWPPGRALDRGEVEDLLAAIDAVVAIPDCRISADGAAPGDSIPLGDREIALARDIRITAEREIEGEGL